MGKVIIISGPVGAGKSAVARELVSLWPGPMACIDGDTFWSFIAKPGQTERRENFHVIMRSMTAACIPFTRSGYDVILDFSVPPHFLQSARKILKEIALEYVILQPAEKICAARAATRSEGAIADYAKYSELYSLFDQFDLFKITDNESSPVEIAVQIQAGLKKGKFYIP